MPLGIPMLAGPGAISSVMVLVGQVPSLWHWEMGAILGSIAVTCLVSYWVLAGAGRVREVMGETGIRILVRIMGLLLVALAMQFFVNGLTDLGADSEQADEERCERFPQNRGLSHSRALAFTVGRVAILRKLQTRRIATEAELAVCNRGVACATLGKLQNEQWSLPVAVWPAR